MPELPEWVSAARQQWRWQGQARPSFATTPLQGQTSVWDFPRPPRIAADAREVIVNWAGVEVARTCRAVLVLETAHPPSYYLPWNDVSRHLLASAAGSSFCEWKGRARYWTLVTGDWLVWRGATRSRLPEPRRWPTAWRSTRRNLTALSVVRP